MNKKRNHVRIMGLSVLLAVVFMLSGTKVALADQASKFVPGTRVNGVLVGGMTVEEAKIQIEGFYGREYNLTLKEREDKTEVIKGTEIDYQVKITDGLEQILTQQNASGRLAGPDEDNSHTLKSTVIYNKEKLNHILLALNCLDNNQTIPTTNAQISSWKEGEPFRIIPEAYGNSVNKDKLKGAIEAALNQEFTHISLEDTGSYDVVTVSSDDTGLIAHCNALNKIKDLNITYRFGDQSEELKGETIASWIDGMEDNQVRVKLDLAGAYIKELADRHDTYGRPRIFRSTDGRELPLNGAYGWQMDQAAETQALIAMIRTGQSQERTPQYRLAASDRNTDWGNTYIEVDMAAQHVYMYQNGVMTWDSPCVTGNMAKNHTTPEGIYTLNYKQTDRILRGVKQPDGTYEYESHVNYWMPFNGGIGFHDANWRSKFGGTIYKKSGSHGCINLPPQKAKGLFSLVSPGIPVICHY
ncbi:L,D-transpeptidase family protein [Clostridium sp. E02]|uniref:L,D-transpeptidase family protein n=1 Tax=Clostridium sp. E02 TaxID=2487134 RepID=UPI000F524634|nr:L,D-transpeptidase family protein [Clostridium sp. E02]